MQAWSRKRRVVNLLAVATAAATLPLLFSGGSVTSYGVGMAVPDWPTTFGEPMVTYDFRTAPFGVIVEHSHRLLGLAVGVLGIVLIAGLIVFERHRGLVGLGAAAFTAICLQGLLGGLRVRLNMAGLGTEFAIVHGVFGQMTFALLVATAVATSRSWWTARTEEHPSGGAIRLTTTAILVVILSQALTGALVRHLGLGFWFHAAGATMLFVAGLWMTALMLGDARLWSPLAWRLGVLMAFVVIQMLLGVGAALVTELVPPGFRRPPTDLEAFLRTTHLLVGSLTLALAVSLWLTAWKRFEPARPRVAGPLTAPFARAAG